MPPQPRIKVRKDGPHTWAIDIPKHRLYNCEVGPRTIFVADFEEAVTLAYNIRRDTRRKAY